MSANTQEFTSEALKLINAGKKDEAIACLDKAIALDSNCGLAYFYKAFVYGQKLQHQEAVDTYDKAISVGYATDGVYYNRGVELTKLGRKQDANNSYDLAAQENPKKWEALENKGHNLIGMDRLEEAKVAFEAALEQNPGKNYAYYIEIGICLENLGRKKEAVEYYRKSLALAPKQARSNHSLGQYAAEEGRHEEAIGYFKTLLEGIPNNSAGVLGLANSYRALGREAEAMEWYKKVDLMKPTIALNYYNMGQIFYILGRKEEAMTHLKKAREMLLTDKGANIPPKFVAHMKATLASILDVEEASEKTQKVVQSLDEKNPAVQKFMASIKALQDKKSVLQGDALKNIEKSSEENTKKLSELDQMKEEFNKQLLAMQSQITSLNTHVQVPDKKVHEVVHNLAKLKEEVDNKMDDFNKKLASELNKRDLSAEAQEKLKDYFKAFVETFSSMHVTAQVVDSGQVQLDVGSSAVTVLSFVASFAPFMGSALSQSVQSIDEFLKSKEMKSNARKLKGLASDAAALSQLIGKVGYETVLNEKKQQQIISTSEQELRQRSDNLFQKVLQFCENTSEKLDAYLYTSLYKTPGQRLGHMDANGLVEKWIKGTIVPFDIEGQFIEEMLKTADESSAGAESSSASPTKTGAKEAPKTACFNIF